MNGELLKKEFDQTASELWRIHEALSVVAERLEADVDRKAARRIFTDLMWATENCTVIGLHQIGEAMNDAMG